MDSLFGCYPDAVAFSVTFDFWWSGTLETIFVQRSLFAVLVSVLIAKRTERLTKTNVTHCWQKNLVLHAAIWCQFGGGKLVFWNLCRFCFEWMGQKRVHVAHMMREIIDHVGKTYGQMNTKWFGSVCRPSRRLPNVPPPTFGPNVGATMNSSFAVTLAEMRN